MTTTTDLDKKTAVPRARLTFALALACLAAIIGLATLSPAPAAADFGGYDHDFQGLLMPSATDYFYIGFDKSGKKLKNLTILSPVICPGYNGLTIVYFHRMKGSVRIANDGSFSFDKKVKFRDAVTAKHKVRLRFSGKIKGKKANGKLRFDANLDDGGTQVKGCTWGTMTWKAKRGATVDVLI